MVTTGDRRIAEEVLVRTPRRTRLALALGVVLAFQATPALGHDDGLTCHEHPTGGWGASVLAEDDWEAPIANVRIIGHILIQVGESGSSRVLARGIASVRGVRVFDTLVSDAGAAAMACSDAGMTGFELVFLSRRTGERATLSIVPVAPIREPGRHHVRYELAYAGGEPTTHDGAILVVSAADGPMP
jgi:hypothetical protein